MDIFENRFLYSGMENYPVIFSIKSIPVIYENIKRNGS